MIKSLGLVVGAIVVLLVVWALSRKDPTAILSQASPNASFSASSTPSSDFIAAEPGIVRGTRESVGGESTSTTPTEPLENDAQKPSENSAVGGVRAASMLEVSVGSFLSSVPDLAGFESAVSLFAEVATVDPTSVTRNPEDGSVRGRLTIPGVDVEASFRIQGSRYQIDLEPSPGNPLPPPFGGRNIAISFVNKDGEAKQISASVQYHPDPRKFAIESIPAETERYTGWNLAMGPDGTSGLPLSIQQSPDGQSWIVGRSSHFSPINAAGFNPVPYTAWLSKLDQFAP